jgi:hypothetical protein
MVVKVKPVHHFLLALLFGRKPSACESALLLVDPRGYQSARYPNDRPCDSLMITCRLRFTQPWIVCELTPKVAAVIAKTLA